MRRYFDACNAADYDALVACFTPDAVHYFPPGLAGVPWRSADTIARGWQECVATLGRSGRSTGWSSATTPPRR